MQEGSPHHPQHPTNVKARQVDSAPQRVFRQPSHPSVCGGGAGGASVGGTSIPRSIGSGQQQQRPRRPNRFANFSYDSSCASSTSNNKRKHLANLRSWHSGTKLLKSPSQRQDGGGVVGEADHTNNLEFKTILPLEDTHTSYADEKSCGDINDSKEDQQEQEQEQDHWDEKNDTKRKSLTMQQLMSSVGNSFRGNNNNNNNNNNDDSRRTSGNSCSLMSSLSTAFSFNSMRSIILQFSTDDLEANDQQDDDEDDDELNLPTCNIEQANHNNTNREDNHIAVPVYPGENISDPTTTHCVQHSNNGDRYSDEANSDTSSSSSCEKRKKKPPKFPWRQISWRSGLSSASNSNNNNNNNKTNSSNSNKEKKKNKHKTKRNKKKTQKSIGDDVSPHQQSSSNSSSSPDKQPQQKRVFQFLLSNQQRQSFNMKTATIQEEDHPHDASATLRMSASSDLTLFPDSGHCYNYGGYCSDPTNTMTSSSLRLSGTTATTITSSSSSLRISGRSGGGGGGGGDHELRFPVRRESYSSHDNQSFSCKSSATPRMMEESKDATTTNNSSSKAISLPVNATTLEKKSFLKRQLQFPKQRLGQVLRRVNNVVVKRKKTRTTTTATKDYNNTQQVEHVATLSKSKLMTTSLPHSI